MSEKTYSIAETKAHLSELAEQAASGATLVITRRGKPIARLSPATRDRKPIDLQRLRGVTEQMPAQPEDAAVTVRRMRGDERY